MLLGGGQDAASVTTTAAKAGGFEARFFHKVQRIPHQIGTSGSSQMDR